jgi:hypothetical protein
MTDEIAVLIERLLACDPKAAKKYLEPLLLKLEELEGDQYFQELLLSLKKEAKNLLEDLRHSQSSELREDWLRLAAYDLRRVRAELLHLRELLRVEKVKSREPEPERLLREIYREGGMSEATWLMVTNHPFLSRCRSGEARKTLLRLSSLLQELRRTRNG